jgi:RNA polymerase sigma-70 factor (ECF subfamily)
MLRSAHRHSTHPPGSDHSSVTSDKVIALLPEAFERYRPRLTLLARVQLGRRLRGKADPDDLVQETFLAAVAAADGFRGVDEAQVLAWLRAILTSRVHKLVERYYGAAARDVRREHPHLFDTPDDSAAGGSRLPPADQSTPSGAALREERAVLVAETLAVLPGDYRDVLVYRSIEGLSFPSVAERMGRSAGAVTMLWARAVRAFRLAFPGQP